MFEGCACGLTDIFLLAGSNLIWWCPADLLQYHYHWKNQKWVSEAQSVGLRKGHSIRWSREEFMQPVWFLFPHCSHRWLISPDTRHFLLSLNDVMLASCWPWRYRHWWNPSSPTLKRGWLLTLSRWGLRGLESVFVLFCLLFIFWDKVPPCNSGWLWVAAILLPHPTNCCDCRCERPCLTFWQLLSSAPPGHASRNRWRLKFMYGPFQVWGASSPESRLSQHMAPCLPFAVCFLWNFRRVDWFSIWNFLFWGTGKLVSKWKLTTAENRIIWPKGGGKSHWRQQSGNLSAFPEHHEPRGRSRKWNSSVGLH